MFDHVYELHHARVNELPGPIYNAWCHCGISGDNSTDALDALESMNLAHRNAGLDEPISATEAERRMR